MIEKEDGDALGVWNKEGVGEIDLVWGRYDKAKDRGFGLSKILQKHIERQKDFDNIEDMVSKVSEVIRSGEVVRRYSSKTKTVFNKDGYLVVLRRNLDNQKNWILTSYDESRSIEDKIEKGCLYDNPFLNHLSLCTASNENLSTERDVFLSNDSISKGTNLFLDNQIFKAKSSPVGTEKTWGGKQYIKTASGWRPKGKQKQGKAEEPSGQKQSFEEGQSVRIKGVEDNMIIDRIVDDRIYVKKPGDSSNTAEWVKAEDIEQETNGGKVSDFASKASDDQLKRAIEDPNQKEEIKQAAQKELDSRNKKQEESKSGDVFDDALENALKEVIDSAEKLGLDKKQVAGLQAKLDGFQNNKKQQEAENKNKELSEKLDKEMKEKMKLLADQEFKPITQTGIKVAGDHLTIKMSGDDKYKAKKGDFETESEPKQPLHDFKQKVKALYSEYKKGTFKPEENYIPFNQRQGMIKERNKFEGSSEVQKQLHDDLKGLAKNLKTDNPELYEEVVREKELFLEGEIWEDTKRVMKASNGDEENLARQIALNLVLLEQGLSP